LKTNASDGSAAPNAIHHVESSSRKFVAQNFTFFPLLRVKQNNLLPPIHMGLFGAQAVARVRTSMRGWSRYCGLRAAKFCGAIALNLYG